MRGAVQLIDLEDTDGNRGDGRYNDLDVTSLFRYTDLKFAFEVREGDSPGYIFITVSPPEKNEWMCAFTILLVRRCVIVAHDTHMFVYIQCGLGISDFLEKICSD